MSTKTDFMSLDQLMDSQPIETPWVVKDLLPSGGLSLIVSQPKVGKSTLLKYLTACVLKGEAFLGHETTKTNVLYIDMEEAPWRIRSQFKDLDIPRGANIDLWMPGRVEKGIAKLEALIKDKSYGLIVVDTLFDLCPVQEVNNYIQTKEVIKPLEAIARRTGAHIISSHHSSKGFGGGPQKVLGSTAIFGMVDTLIYLSGYTANTLSIATTVRHGTGLPSTKLVRQGPRFSLGKTMAASSIDTLKDAIADHLMGENGGVGVAAIVSELGVTKKRALSALDMLLKEKAITRTGGGKSGDPYLYHAYETDQKLYRGDLSILRPSTAP